MFANVLIAIVGAGVLGFSYAFKQTGWIMGLLMFFSVAGLTTYCMMLLIHTRRKLESFDNGFTKITSFDDLGFAVCGSVGRNMVDLHTHAIVVARSVSDFEHVLRLSHGSTDLGF